MAVRTTMMFVKDLRRAAKRCRRAQTRPTASDMARLAVLLDEAANSIEVLTTPVATSYVEYLQQVHQDRKESRDAQADQKPRR